MPKVLPPEVEDEVQVTPAVLLHLFEVIEEVILDHALDAINVAHDDVQRELGQFKRLNELLLELAYTSPNPIRKPPTF